MCYTGIVAAYIVRPRLSGQAKQTGQEGAGGVVIYAANPQKAKELGAARLGIPSHQLEAVETEDRSFMAVQTTGPLTEEEIEQIKEDMYSGEVKIGGGWEHNKYGANRE